VGCHLELFLCLRISGSAVGHLIPGGLRFPSFGITVLTRAIMGSWKVAYETRLPYVVWNESLSSTAI
jgi:hypothetical protein